MVKVGPFERGANGCSWCPIRSAAAAVLARRDAVRVTHAAPEPVGHRGVRKPGGTTAYYII